MITFDKIADRLKLGVTELMTEYKRARSTIRGTGEGIGAGIGK